MRTYDITNFQKPARLKKVAAKTCELVHLMRAAGKEPISVALFRADYSDIISAINKGAGIDDKFTDLCVGSVSVVPA